MSGSHYSWSNPRVLLTLSLIFICGALVGALSVTISNPPTRYLEPVDPRSNVALTLSQLTNDLELSEAQQAKLQVVLDDYFQFYHALQDQLDGLKADGRENIIKILNDEQRVKFEKMLTIANSKAK